MRHVWLRNFPDLAFFDKLQRNFNVG